MLKKILWITTFLLSLILVSAVTAQDETSQGFPSDWQITFNSQQIESWEELNQVLSTIDLAGPDYRLVFNVVSATDRKMTINLRSYTSNNNQDGFWAEAEYQYLGASSQSDGAQLEEDFEIDFEWWVEANLVNLIQTPVPEIGISFSDLSLADQVEKGLIHDEITEYQIFGYLGDYGITISVIFAPARADNWTAYTDTWHNGTLAFNPNDSFSTRVNRIVDKLLSLTEASAIDR